LFSLVLETLTYHFEVFTGRILILNGNFTPFSLLVNIPAYIHDISFDSSLVKIYLGWFMLV